MDQIHGSHCASCIIEKPFLHLVDVSRVLFVESVHNVANELLGFGVILCDSFRGHTMQNMLVEDVAFVFDLIQKAEEHKAHRKKKSKFEEATHNRWTNWITLEGECCKNSFGFVVVVVILRVITFLFTNKLNFTARPGRILPK